MNIYFVKKQINNKLTLKKKLLLFLLLLISFQFIDAQSRSFYLHGMLRDSITLIKDVHVVNLNRQQGTFSNDYGQYRIIASLGDTIEFTSVQYETVRKVITDQIVFGKKLHLVLKRNSYVLDEIVLKKHDLTGILYTDRKKVPKDSIAAIARGMNELIVEFSNKPQQGFDIQESMVKKLAKTSAKNADPTKSFEGIGGAIGLRSRNKKKNRLKKITSSTFSTNSILIDFENDFFEDLKIPKDKITLFIDYCKQFNIKELYEQGKELQLIKLLEDKSSLFIKESKEK